MRIIWKNGSFLEEHLAFYSIYDEGCMFGTIVFEMFRSFNKNVFKFDEHIERLKMSCKILEIQINYWDHLRDYYNEVVSKNVWEKDDEIRGLINISRGILPMYSEAGMGKSETNIIIACFPLKYVLKGKSNVYTEGVDVIVSFQRAISESFLDAKIKSRSRQHYKLADLQVQAYKPDAWALLLDDDGFVAEGTGSNFFIVKDRVVYTPEGRNCLRGVSRKHIMDLCYLKVIDCYEKNLTLYDVYNADEAFFTNTPYCIVPIRSINGKRLNCVGTTTEFLMETWEKEVKCPWREQARKWDSPG